LLDEENVRSVARGPICENCGVEVKRNARICIDCGFNLETGDKLSTEAGEDVENTGGMTGTEQMLRKAERELEESEDDFDPEDFGDGAESYLIAGVAGFFGLLLIGIGMTVILTMEQLSLLMNPAGISLIASIGLFFGMWVWISLVAFKASSAHGIACLASLGLYCPIFGFMQGKSLILPSIVILVSILMMIATGVYVSYSGWGPAGV
jgi:ribosomal protein L32